MRRNRQAILIIGLGTLLVLAWAAVVALAGWQAQFADNSWQSNQIRIQRYLIGAQPPKAVLLGSSVTGRFLPDYFRNTSLPDTANLGLDGSGPLLGATLIKHREGLPQLVIVETFLIDKPWTAGDSNMLASVDGFSPWLAGRLPVLRAEHRPTSLLYSWIKKRKEATYATQGHPPTAEGPRNPTAAMKASVAQLEETLGALQKSGVKVILARFPTGESREGLLRDLPPDHPALAIAKTLHLPLVDVAKAAVADGWEPLYTDGLHLNAASARRVSETLASLAAEYLK